MTQCPKKRNELRKEELQPRMETWLAKQIEEKAFWVSIPGSSSHIECHSIPHFLRLFFQNSKLSEYMVWSIFQPMFHFESKVDLKIILNTEFH